jgi:hypothetical protein
MKTRHRAGIAAVVLALATVFAADLAAQKQGDKPPFRGWTGTVHREQRIDYTCKSTVPGIKDRTYHYHSTTTITVTADGSGFVSAQWEGADSNIPDPPRPQRASVSRRWSADEEGRPGISVDIFRDIPAGQHQVRASANMPRDLVNLGLPFFYIRLYAN